MTQQRNTTSGSLAAWGWIIAGFVLWVLAGTMYSAGHYATGVAATFIGLIVLFVGIVAYLSP